MARQELILESSRFTNTSAVAREILALLEFSDYKIEVHMTAAELERVSNELENVRSLGRVTVVIVNQEEAC